MTNNVTIYRKIFDEAREYLLSFDPVVQIRSKRFDHYQRLGGTI